MTLFGPKLAENYPTNWALAAARSYAVVALMAKKTYLRNNWWPSPLAPPGQ
jgi:hypothetical protein